MAERFRGSGIILRFIEYMDVGTTNGWRLDDVVPADEIVERLAARWPLTPVAPNYPGEVACRYRYDDGGGEMGVIASVTRPFCGACTRARISAEGELYTCLFAAHGTDLREPLRAGATDEQILDLLGATWRARADRYSETARRGDGARGAGRDVAHRRLTNHPPGANRPNNRLPWGDECVGRCAVPCERAAASQGVA